ncbi:hypothetical protein C7M84_006152 [Penaeus vannamei]|uniref:Uncharacterized protein n=1 Tax=Penaeus vannamei TaxID=6689 RepID=A0A423TFS4_PENVA|nr:hypothetical protein C7M84_006152 [Penaeus vannamei]
MRRGIKDANKPRKQDVRRSTSRQRTFISKNPPPHLSPPPPQTPSADTHPRRLSCQMTGARGSPSRLSRPLLSFLFFLVVLELVSCAGCRRAGGRGAPASVSALESQPRPPTPCLSVRLLLLLQSLRLESQPRPPTPCLGVRGGAWCSCFSLCASSPSPARPRPLSACVEGVVLLLQSLRSSPAPARHALSQRAWRGVGSASVSAPRVPAPPAHALSQRAWRGVVLLLQSLRLESQPRPPTPCLSVRGGAWCSCFSLCASSPSPARPRPVSACVEGRGAPASVSAPRVPAPPAHALSRVRGVVLLLQSLRLESQPRPPRPVSACVEGRGAPASVSAPRVPAPPAHALSQRAWRGVVLLLQSLRLESQPRPPHALSQRAWRGVVLLLQSLRLESQPRPPTPVSACVEGVVLLLQSLRLESQPRPPTPSLSVRGGAWCSCFSLCAYSGRQLHLLCSG